MEGEIAKTEERIAPLDEQEQRLRKSLDLRRSVIAEVLAALQRIGRHHHPPSWYGPKMRCSRCVPRMLLGSVLPEMRQETNAILTDLSEWCASLRDRRKSASASERDLKTLADESPRLAS